MCTEDPKCLIDGLLGLFLSFGWKLMSNSHQGLCVESLEVYHSSWHVKSLKLVQLMTEPGCGWPQTAAVTTWESEPYKLNDNLQRLSNVNWCWSYLSSQYDRGDGPYTAALCKPFWYPNTGRFSLIQDKENT